MLNHNCLKLVILLIATFGVTLAEARSSSGALTAIPQSANSTTQVSGYVPSTTTQKDYTQLPACTDASHPTLTCPELQSTAMFNVAQSANCPDVCTVTRNPAVVNSFIQGDVIQNAVCPAGYSQIASYNVQNDIVYNPPVALQNVQSVTQLATLQQNKYVLYSYSAWKGSYDNPGLGTSACDPPVTKGGYFDVNNIIAAMWIAPDRMSPGETYRIYDWTTDWDGCAGSCFKCASAFATHARVKKIYVDKILYQVPGGITPTGNKITASVVCGRNKQQWLKTQ